MVVAVVVLLLLSLAARFVIGDGRWLVVVGGGGCRWVHGGTSEPVPRTFGPFIFRVNLPLALSGSGLRPRQREKKKKKNNK